MDQLTTMQTEFQTKSQSYQSKRSTMADAARIAAEGELGDLQKRIQDYQQTAEKAVEAKGNELIKPVADKAKAAVAAIAKEKGYTYVFDSSTTAFIVSPEGDDLMPAAKLKLGLK
jgi:outer membrane protein